MDAIQRPSFICFTGTMETPDKKGSAHMIARIEEMELTNEQIIAIKDIQEKAATDLRKVLGL